MPIEYVCNKCGRRKVVTNVPGPRWTIIGAIGGTKVYCPECSKSDEIRKIKIGKLLEQLPG
ncbi:MAG: hypothetical protein PF549_04975 [Patescibacteria group bacterium]|jgi:DNA-directed RNA polymerase subunit RPC12/RpoP|nr:hypothetical protein [Patescibacteria group bacterium]